MDLSTYVDTLRADLLQLAAASGPDVRAAAERLSDALDPAVRMTLVNVLADAAAEITHDLPAGSVDVRMRGRDPDLVVDLVEPRPAHAEDYVADDEDDDVVARVTVRIPEAVKTRAEESAAERGQSLNTWIVQAVRAALRNRGIHVDVDLSSRIGPTGSAPPYPLFGERIGRSVKGWSR